MFNHQTQSLALTNWKAVVQILGGKITFFFNLALNIGKNPFFLHFQEFSILTDKVQKVQNLTSGALWGSPKFLAWRLRYKGKNRCDGVTLTIIEDDFTSADKIEFERHQKCIRRHLCILKNLSQIIVLYLCVVSVFPEKFAFYFGCKVICDICTYMYSVNRASKSNFQY